jgi:hypothetical protein
VICGHIHHATIKHINGTLYINTGDFVESCTAVAEHADGRFEIIVWQRPADAQTAPAQLESEPHMMARAAA